MSQILSLRLAKTIAFDEAPFTAAARDLFVAIGIDVATISSTHVHGPPAPEVDLTGQTLTHDQRLLYGVPDGSDSFSRNYALVCFVGELPQQSEGFSNPRFASCLISSNCKEHTLAHELGHLLGLAHVSDPSNLMYEFGPQEELAPGLNATQRARALASPLLVSRADFDARRGAVELAAYYRWLDRGGDHGRALEDWVAAENGIG